MGPATRINEAIRVPRVRLIDQDGENQGVVETARAQKMAADAKLDLVEVAADAKPPVCRIMNYSRWRYEQERKAKEARKRQKIVKIKEIKFRPKVDDHDYATKAGHVERFLLHEDKVKVTIMFRGREMAHPERGRMILDRLAQDMQELAQVESKPNLEGRNMIMMLAPIPAAIARRKEELAAAGDLDAALAGADEAGIDGAEQDEAAVAAMAQEQAEARAEAAARDELLAEDMLVADADEEAVAA